MLDILFVMKGLSLKFIVYYNAGSLTDYQTIVVQFLASKGYFLFQNQASIVTFRDGEGRPNLHGVLQQILPDYNIALLDINRVPPEALADMKMDVTSLPEKLQRHISRIREEHKVDIQVGKFSNLPKSSVRNHSQIFLNYEHETFRSLLEMLHFSDAQFKIYLLGILGLGLHGTSLYRNN
ncbi:hypothetical protein MKQ68_19030 [Chitinophaga horti]|uniref:Uncharacterized protein n=1 Tax=Chitinophaga horti TaxID=2920382 RepID=A0ABY6J1U6_9BACT|nr:hypothetical protein [Chitinophaga horti]UYQ92184.1 hypothetical protein MKQ68_19030 [Chitinophaga horti]